jgi:hypothetical protein
MSRLRRAKYRLPQIAQMNTEFSMSKFKIKIDHPWASTILGQQFGLQNTNRLFSNFDRPKFTISPTLQPEAFI